ncbi:MAG: DNA polymerase III subunit beta [Nitrospirae bacterium]|nr:DNA polymerase III subunit beta [Nitrospirota bacterium]
MKLKVERDEIQSVLQNIQGIVEKKTTMPVLSHFLLKADKAISVIATDLDITIISSLKADIIEKGSLCIPARKLFEITKELEDSVLLESQENNWLRVSSGKSTFKLMGLPEAEYPAMPEVSQAENIILNAKTLKDMIEKTIYATGDNDLRYTLNGILMHFIPKKKAIELKVVGTDGHRLSLISKEIEGKLSEEKKLILPKKAAVEISRLLGENVVTITVGLNKNHMFFTMEDLTLTSRLIEGTYPNYDQVIPKGNEKKMTADKATFLKAIKRTSIMSREGTNAIRFDIEPGKLTMISINPDLGEAREEISVQYKGDPLSIGFNARYVMDAAKAMGGEAIRFDLQDSLSPTLMQEAEDKDYSCVVMPMRI